MSVVHAEDQWAADLLDELVPKLNEATTAADLRIASFEKHLNALGLGLRVSFAVLDQGGVAGFIEYAKRDRAWRIRWSGAQEPPGLPLLECSRAIRLLASVEWPSFVSMVVTVAQRYASGDPNQMMGGHCDVA